MNESRPSIHGQTVGNSVPQVRVYDLLVAILHEWKIVATVTFSFAMIAFLVATYLIPPTYTATTQLLPPQQPQSNTAALLGSLAGGNSSTAGVVGLKNPADQWIGLLKSKTIAAAVVQQFDLTQVYETKLKSRAIRQLESRTNIIAMREGMIKIEVDDQEPQRAADIANAYVKQLQLMTKNLALSEASQRRAYFEKLMRESKDNLVQAELKLKEGSVSDSILRASPEKVTLNMSQLKAQLSMQEVKVANLETYVTDGASVLIQARAELAELKRQLADLMKGKGLDEAGGAGNYIARYRDYKYFETLFEIMAKQYEMARADEARQGVALQVVDVAEAPDMKSKPRRGVMTMAAGLAGLLTCSAYLSIGFLRRNHNSPI